MCEFQDMNEITAENCDISDRNTIDSDSADMDINFSDSMDMNINSSDPDELDDDTCEDDICKQDDYYSRSILNDYLKQIASYPRLSEEETRELLLRKDTDPSARTKLINHNLRLVVHVVKYTNRRGMDFMDLIQVGNENLMHGIDKFEPDRNTKLSTYVVPWIRQGVQRAIANQSRTIRIPLETFTQISNMNVYINAYKRDYGREPSENEIADYLHITIPKVKDLKSWSQSTLSLDKTLVTDEGSGKTFGDMLSVGDTVTAAAGDSDADSIDRLIDNEALLTAMKTLTPRETIVIARRFGLGFTDAETLDQIAEDLGVTKEAVRQIQIRALRKLSDEMNSEKKKTKKKDRKKKDPEKKGKTEPKK